MNSDEIIANSANDIIAHSVGGFNRAPAQLEQFRHMLEARIASHISGIYYDLMYQPDLVTVHPHTSDEYPSEVWELAAQKWQEA